MYVALPGWGEKWICAALADEAGKLHYASQCDLNVSDTGTDQTSRTVSDSPGYSSPKLVSAWETHFFLKNWHVCLVKLVKGICTLKKVLDKDHLTPCTHFWLNYMSPVFNCVRYYFMWVSYTLLFFSFFFHIWKVTVFQKAGMFDSHKQRYQNVFCFFLGVLWRV